ncbi:MAG TPA: Gfo/Idh/MocA family oxidoreductase [Gemmataceae bacterium]|nr:Gfo/Idh/MocA family oxidoreductase [Gemmataceae bacterium]
MVRIGIVGIGFMGMIHYLAARKLKGAKVTAICSRDPKKLAGDWRGIRGNFGPPGEKMDLSGIKKYSRLEDLLADPDIDLVDVCNPTNLHPETALQALRAGKHVMVEKAIALQPRDADEMVKAASAAGKLLMVAHVLPFFPEFAYAAEVIRGGEYGKVLGAHFKRVISKPDWSAEIADVKKTGGPAVDLHIHDTHFIGLVCGVPAQVFATGVMEGDAVTYLTTSYLYGPGGPAVTCSSGALAQKAREFVHGYEIYLEKATLVYESGTVPLTVLVGSKTKNPKLKGGDDPLTAFTRELQAAVDGIEAGKEPDLLSGKLARDALVLCHKECESVKIGKPVAVA